MVLRKVSSEGFMGSVYREAPTGKNHGWNQDPLWNKVSAHGGGAISIDNLPFGVNELFLHFLGQR